MLSQSDVPNLPRQTVFGRSASSTHAPKDMRAESTPMQNMFVGSMYWEKVASNRVYPKWATECEREEMFPQSSQEREEKGDEDLNEIDDEVGNL